MVLPRDGPAASRRALRPRSARHGGGRVVGGRVIVRAHFGLEPCPEAVPRVHDAPRPEPTSADAGAPRHPPQLSPRAEAKGAGLEGRKVQQVRRAQRVVAVAAFPPAKEERRAPRSHQGSEGAPRPERRAVSPGGGGSGGGGSRSGGGGVGTVDYLTLQGGADDAPVARRRGPRKDTRAQGCPRPCHPCYPSPPPLRPLPRRRALARTARRALRA